MAHAAALREEGVHLRHLLGGAGAATRASSMCARFDGAILDYSRQLAVDAGVLEGGQGESTMRLLFELARATDLVPELQTMRDGEHLNTTENRAVMHMALRASVGDSFFVDGVDVVPEVEAVRARIRSFSDRVRSGEWLGATGKPLTTVVAVGIGGSYLGPEFV